MRIIARFIWRFLFALSALIGLTVVILLSSLAAAIWFGGGVERLAATTEDVPDGAILRLVIDPPLAETAATTTFAAAFGAGRETFRDVVDALTRGAADDRVAALIVDLSQGRLPMAQIQELRQAVQHFRAQGKTAYAFAAGYGNGSYYLASAFDQVWLQPSGDFAAAGFAAEVPFARDLLDQIGVEPAIEKRGPYKTAFDSLTETGLTPANREALQSLIDTLGRQWRAAVAQDRGLAETEITDLVAAAPFGASRALSAGLVDRLGYWNELEDQAILDTGTTAEDPFLTLRDYLRIAGRPHQDGTTIALIQAVGQIVRGKRATPFDEGRVVYAADLVRAIAAADRDDQVQALIVRIDSPGGSYVASDEIWAALRAVDKPVVASLGGVAASGGYFIAAAADRIVAEPGTITGSIGVIAGKFVTRDMWSKLGVDWQRLQTAPNATMMSATQPFTATQAAQFAARIDRVYNDFVAKVAEGRGQGVAAVRAQAEGRVWTGDQALERGLVDRLGGLGTALSEAMTLAGRDPAGPIEVKVFPERDRFGFLENLLDDGFWSLQAILRGGRDLALLTQAIDPARRQAVLQAQRRLADPDAILLLQPALAVR